MIDAAQPLNPKRQAPDPVAAGLVRSDIEDTAAPQVATGSPDVKVAERQQQVAPAHAPFETRVHLDGETMRVYSEITDPENDRVIRTLPFDYDPTREAKAPQPETSIEA